MALGWAARLNVLACCAVAAGLAGCSGEVPEPQANAAPATQRAGDATRPASLPVVDLAGLQALVKETAGQDRLLVIDFWATWCVPCVEMFPALHKGLHDLGDDKVRKVTVTLDAPGKFEQAAIAFLSEHGAMADAYLLDPDPDKQEAVPAGIAKKWNTLVVPAILVFDRRGELAAEFVEGQPAEKIVEHVRALAEQAGPQASTSDVPGPSAGSGNGGESAKGPSS